MTGHSMGAAQAVYGGDEIARQFPDTKVTVYSFGTPRPGDIAFAHRIHALPNLETWAVAHRADTVPQCGIDTPPCDERALGYHQVLGNVWYPDGLSGAPPVTAAKPYYVCDGTGEDPQCQDEVDQRLLNWNDHDLYLNHSMWCCPKGARGPKGCAFPFSQTDR